MKKLICLAVCLLMIFSAFTGCKPAETANADLVNAKDYLVNMYQKGDKNEAMKMLMDTDVVSVVVIGGVSYAVDWKITVTQGAADSIKVAESQKANHVLIDVPELPETDILFTLTATVKDEAGNTESANFSYKVTGLNISNKLTAEEIITQAYALEKGKAMDGTHSLTGKITKIDTPYDATSKVVTVTITVDGFEDKPFKCMRLTGEGADTLAVNDYITVTGTISNFEGVVEFNAGCTVSDIVKDTPTVTPTPAPDGSTPQIVTDVKKIMTDAKALEHEAKLSYTAVLTGKVIAVDEAYDSQYKNITVTIKVTGYDDTPIKCYRLTGTNVEKIEKNDTITVTGVIKKYNKTVEFEFGCTMTKRISGGGVKQETDPAKIMEAAYALKSGENLGYDVTLEGKVKSIDAAYNPQFKNISVVIEVAGKELVCYRMVGNDVDKVVGGDTITVSGTIKNYNGTIEFDSGCTMRKRVSGGVTAPTNPKEIVDAAFKLEPGASLLYSATLTGKILEINDPYDSGYKNISVTIEVEGTTQKYELKCFRMKGDGADALKVGDVITVTGIIKNYKHSSGDCEVEFDAGCTFTK
ncbi:MAG: hypothetical protein IKB86_08215 [Clostridia bacterium]|nr:hypothetical protein [Clostridia bacterium]